jgi:hypothetical protein
VLRREVSRGREFFGGKAERELVEGFGVGESNAG